MKPAPKKNIPFEFVLENLSRIDFTVKAFFGCHSIYIRDAIMIILRNKEKQSIDNGIWLATSKEHHTSLQSLFPNMRSIEAFGAPTSNWQILPFDAYDFEESVLKVCELILKRDPRIGRIPNQKKKSPTKKKSN